MEIWHYGIQLQNGNVMLALSALESIFDDMGVDFEHGKAETMTYHAYATSKNQINLLKKQ